MVNTYSYEPYGKLASSSGTTANPWRFGGSYGAYTENNTSGLLKIGQRFYDPTLGRWTQQDPVLHLGDPRQWNRYVYGACDPIDFIDPTGTVSKPRCTRQFLTFVAGVALLLVEVASLPANPLTAVFVGATGGAAFVAGRQFDQCLDVQV